MEISNSVPLIVAIAVVLIIVGLQIWSFVNTKLKIIKLKKFVPQIDALKLKETSIQTSVLKNRKRIQQFIHNVPERKEREYDEVEEYIDVTLIESTSGTKISEPFSQIINRTNEYLCKNVGTSADFEILKSICEHQIETLEDEIHNSLNVPLYLGLGGTFIGIITGLWGVEFKEILASSGNMDGLQHLIYGIIGAMLASCLGLSLTVWNSAIAYKKAIISIDNRKEDYFDFLRRELMPVLSNSMASSLNSLKGVLGHFVDKFGRNLDTYTDSAELLNENLEKQHLVLEELNKLSLTRTANKIAETFVTLKDSSESLNVFKTYQTQLNSTISNLSNVVGKVDTVIEKFDDFGHGLSTVVKNQNRTSELQQNFQNAIETHFPTGSEGREVWREEFDLLMNDAKQASESLSTQLTASTSHIEGFVSQNQDFFDSFDKMKEVLGTLVQYTQVQSECYKDLKGEILSLRTDYRNAQIENIDLNKAMLNAVKTMTETIKQNNKPQVNVIKK